MIDSDPFGIKPLKGEGKPLHPDDVVPIISDEKEYQEQLKRYNDWAEVINLKGEKG